MLRSHSQLIQKALRFSNPKHFFKNLCVLVDFIEKEPNFRNLCWKWDQDQKTVNTRIHSLELQVYTKFQASFHHEFCPQSNLEAFLLERAITCAWKLNLVMKVEAEMFRGDAVWGVPKRIKDAFEGHSYNYMSVISRYENALERSFYKALAEFRQAQQKRESIIAIGFVS